MSIQTQKILMFIPIINLIVFCMYPVALLHKGTTVKQILIAELQFIGIVAAINIPRLILLSFNLPEIANTILFLVSAYLTLFAIAFFSVKKQEQLAQE